VRLPLRPFLRFVRQRFDAVVSLPLLELANTIRQWIFSCRGGRIFRT
jgi:hypothetical protein